MAAALGPGIGGTSAAAATVGVGSEFTATTRLPAADDLLLLLPETWVAAVVAVAAAGALAAFETSPAPRSTEATREPFAPPLNFQPVLLRSVFPAATALVSTAAMVSSRVKTCEDDDVEVAAPEKASGACAELVGRRFCFDFCCRCSRC